MPRRFSKRVFAMTSFKDGIGGLLSRLDTKSQLPLLRLWQHWSMVLGEELSSLALPLGVRGDTLLIGATDTLALQELSYSKADILERVNIFLEAVPEAPVLQRLELSLDFGRTALCGIASATPPPPPPKQKPPCPDDILDAYHVMRPDSVVGACYFAYLRMYNKDMERKDDI